MVLKNQQFDHSTESNCGLWIGPMWGRLKAFHGFPIWMRSWTPATIRCFDVKIRGTVEGMGWRTLITKFWNDFMWSIVGINMYIINHKTSFNHIIIQLKYTHYWASMNEKILVPYYQQIPSPSSKLIGAGGGSRLPCACAHQGGEVRSLLLP